MKIRFASEQPIVKKMGGYRRFVERLVMERWGTRVNWAVQGDVYAEVVRSNWVVRCPFCAASQVVDNNVPFYCADCCNQANGGMAMTVVFPGQWQDIVYLLMKRPDPNTRNWLIGETLEDLWAENLAHGLEV